MLFPLPALQAIFTISTKQNEYQYFPYTFVLPEQIPLALLCHGRIQQDNQHLHLEWIAGILYVVIWKESGITKSFGWYFSVKSKNCLISDDVCRLKYICKVYFTLALANTDLATDSVRAYPDVCLSCCIF